MNFSSDFSRNPHNFCLKGKYSLLVATTQTDFKQRDTISQSAMKQRDASRQIDITWKDTKTTDHDEMERPYTLYTMYSSILETVMKQRSTIICYNMQNFSELQEEIVGMYIRQKRTKKKSKICEALAEWKVRYFNNSASVINFTNDPLTGKNWKDFLRTQRATRQNNIEEKTTDLCSKLKTLGLQNNHRERHAQEDGHMQLDTDRQTATRVQRHQQKVRQTCTHINTHRQRFKRKTDCISQIRNQTERPP